MTTIDACGIYVLIYATVIAVWTLCDAHATAVRDLADQRERPSSLPRSRW